MPRHVREGMGLNGRWKLEVERKTIKRVMTVQGSLSRIESPVLPNANDTVTTSRRLLDLAGALIDPIASSSGCLGIFRWEPRGVNE